MTREEAIELWADAQINWGCSCLHNPPCNFCVDGYSLDLDEYLSYLDLEDDVETVPDHITDYERAMRGI